MREIIVEAANVAEAKENALKELRVNKDYVSFEEINECSVKAFINKDVEKIIYEYLSNFFNECGIEYTIDIKREEKALNFVIDTNDNPLLIGREGKILNSLQFIVRQIAFSYDTTYQNVSIDIGGYKQSRNMHLEMLATKTAKEVARTKIPAKLKELNSYERRIVHAKLSEWRDVETESVGVEPNRYLEIKPKKQ